MLSANEIRLKIAALEDEAFKLGDAQGAGFRDLAMRWRLLEVEAVFMDVMGGALADDEGRAE